MKPTAVLINIARGPVVNEDALYAALLGKRIGGAVIDVWWQSGAWLHKGQAGPASWPSRLPFEQLDNVIMTSHTSSATPNQATEGTRELAVILDNLALGKPLINVVRNATMEPPSTGRAIKADDDEAVFGSRRQTNTGPQEFCFVSVQNDSSGVWWFAHRGQRFLSKGVNHVNNGGQDDGVGGRGSPACKAGVTHGAAKIVGSPLCGDARSYKIIEPQRRDQRPARK